MASLSESSKPNEMNTKQNISKTKKRKFILKKNTKPVNENKSKFISKIPVPNVISSSEENGYMKFTVESINVSIINAIRRTILADIPVIVLDTLSKDSVNISKNTSLLNNEILKQRLGCIPVHIKDTSIPVDSLQVHVKLNNTANSFMYVTTKDFKIYDTKSETYLSEDKNKEIFPKNKITDSYILFARLKPRISDNIPGEEIELTCGLKKSSARESGMYNVACSCGYKNTVDRVKQNDVWQEKEKELAEEENMNEEYIEFEKENWFLSDALRYYKKDSFDFALESIGIYSNTELIHLACDILIEKLNTIKSETEVENKSYEIIDFPVAMKNSFDIKLYNEDYTVGKVLEYILHYEYYREQGILSYVGFTKKHPHDTYSFVRIAFNDKYSETLSNRIKIMEILKSVCQIGIGIFTKFKEYF